MEWLSSLKECLIPRGFLGDFIFIRIGNQSGKTQHACATFGYAPGSQSEKNSRNFVDWEKKKNKVTNCSRVPWHELSNKKYESELANNYWKKRWIPAMDKHSIQGKIEALRENASCQITHNDPQCSTRGPRQLPAPPRYRLLIDTQLFLIIHFPSKIILTRTKEKLKELH